MPSFTQNVKVDNQDMELYVSVPEGAGPFPGVVVGQHAGGVDTFIRTMTDRLAEAGYAAAAPDLYHRLGPDEARTPRQLKDVEMVADVRATVDFLQHHSAINREALGVTGFCMGGRVAYLMATAIPEFKAAVAYYGGNIMVALGEGVVPPFDRTREISCPLMFHFGEEDGNPSPDDMHKLDAELTRHNKTHEFYAYPNAGHAFMDFTGERHREDAATASWPRTLEFFGRHLGGVQSA
ncbi:MAG: dienelactone hydrolase family protein [Candidatus Poribacteria bacterium]|nr:dienelactone hydrolase family protein [Candidatus Poribacteria bacterium]